MSTQILPSIIFVTAFVAVALAVQAITALIFSRIERKKRINRRLTLLDGGMNAADVYATLVRRPLTAAVEEESHKGIRALQSYYEQAGLTFPFSRFLGMLAGSAALIWLFLIASVGMSGETTAVSAMAMFLGVCAFVVTAAWVWVSGKRAGRLKAFEEQFPAALDIMDRALRAGHPVIAAMQLAAKEMGDPIGSEFGLVVDETTYGVPFDKSLRNFARRTGSRHAAFFAVSVAIQTETGGNLGEVLVNLATVLRGRVTLRKRIRALSSEGRASALILSVLPIFLIMAMLVIHPGFYTSKFSDPIFWPIVAVIVGDYVLGFVMMYRIINFKF